MREIVLDTETTGLDPALGDRIVEIGAVELVNHMPTGRSYHAYVNPERDVPQDAVAVHGLSAAFLADKPTFVAIAEEFTAFIGDARLVIHNAGFDMKFLNAELGWAGRPALPLARAVDTIELARRRFPGAQNSLDALCRRFGVDNSAREKHGALLDSELLAEVYLELIGGRQPDLTLTVVSAGADFQAGAWTPPPRPRPLRTPDHRRGGRGACRVRGRTGRGRALGADLRPRSGLRRGFGALGLPARDLGAVERQKVDHFEVHRRIAAIARDVGDDAAQERKDQPRAFDHQERMQLVGRHVLDQEQPGVVDLHDEDRADGSTRLSTFSFRITS